MKVPSISLKSSQNTLSTSVGDALQGTGFFALGDHGIDPKLIADVYEKLEAFFALPDATKKKYEEKRRRGQRGYTSFGTEHAKGSNTADLKEFWQVGRVDVPDDHPVHLPNGANLWPDAEVPGFSDSVSQLYSKLESIGCTLLTAAAEYLNEESERIADVVREGDTILRLIHYPPVTNIHDGNAVRAAAHEDINILTVLCGATEDGLELLSHDKTWVPIKAAHDELMVDAGDMLQNLTNGIYKSTTHRVVRPKGEAAKQPRYSIPCFIHARPEVDLKPLASCVARCGGEERYPAITASAYLNQRLKEIGLA